MCRSFFIVAIALLLVQDLFGQKLIFGRVADGTTHEPLPYVSVYINNSTIGTPTNERGEYSLKIPKGKHELVFSLVGYLTHKLNVSVVGNDTTKLDINLMLSKKYLQTITVRGSEDKEWEKLMRQFRPVFLGDTRSASDCVIKNDWCINLTNPRVEGKKVLLASASQPLDIENLALGYRISYELQNFASTDENERFSGNVYFVELKPKDAGQAERWSKNRNESYKGSLRHFFMSILTKQVSEEGFALFECMLTADKKLQKIGSYHPDSIRIDSLADRLRIRLPNAIQINYKNPANSNNLLVGNIFNNKGNIEIDDQGMLLDPLAVTITGYLGTFRVADQLPDNYRPDLGPNN